MKVTKLVILLLILIALIAILKDYYVENVTSTIRYDMENF